MTRRAAAGALALMPLMRAARAAPAIRVTDIAGREVALDAPARRIVLGAWVSLDALSLIHPDPVGLLAGWAGDEGANRHQLAGVRARFPGIDAVPVVGRGTADTLPVEAVVAARPDAVVLSRFDAFRYGDAGTNPALERIESAGIPVVVVDFFLDPLRNTVDSLRVLGRVLGREAQAEAFAAFYRARLGAVERRLTEAGLARPSVLMHAFAARQECCWTTGRQAREGFVQAAGGHNIGADALSGAIGQLSLEYVYARDPAVYVATGGADDKAAEGGFALGRGVPAARARADFETLLSRPHLAALGAVAAGRAHGLWHNFVHTPLHVAAIEVLAKWFHPDLFRDLDPAATLEAINTRFLAVALEGTFWVDRGGPAGATAR